MTYASGGLIEATDYNNLVGSNPTDVAGTLNRILSTGFSDRGYGQTAVSQVSVGNTVTAAQWASLINNLNNCYAHQLGTTTSLAAPTAGTLVTWSSSLAGYITDINNFRLQSANLGSTATYSGSISMSAAASVAATGSATRVVTFSSVDACRYFWNAGGNIQIDIVSTTNNNGTSRSESIRTLTYTNFNDKQIRARSASARSGSGGIVTTDIQTSGFYELNTGYTTFVRINGTSYPYSGDYVQYDILTNGTAGSNGGNGSAVTLLFQAYSSTTGATGTDDALNVTINYVITVRYPSTTYLTNSWGVVTIS
jgi:hypothetical protein